MMQSQDPRVSQPSWSRHSQRMLGRLAAGLAAVTAVVCIPASRALAAGVTPAHGSTRSALVRAFIAQDGTSRGINGVYVLGTTGIVCQRTPDAGLVRFLFRRRASAWRFAFSPHGTAQGTATQRRLERACH
jgi:hypothetical protein